MDCPACKYPDSRVIETRQKDNETITRRRECVRCGKRVTTIEHVKEAKANAR
jgi:transcriptional repressor NrdR